MKKIFFIDSVRSGAAVLLLALLCLLPCARVSAQGVQSAQYQFPSAQGWNVVARESVAGDPVMSCIWGGTIGVDAGVHVLYGDISTNSVREFLIMDTVSQAGVIGHEIKDMRVVGDMCYFCGTRTVTGSEYDPVTGLLMVDSIGMLGRFQLDPSGFGTTIQYDLNLIDGTKSLDRMATYVYGLDTMIAMIGIEGQLSSWSCLVVARVTFRNPWEYTVRYISGNPREVFTDIAIDSAWTVISSYHRDAQGKKYFCLRASESESLHMHDNYAQFNDRYKYYTAQQDNCIGFYRWNYAAVRLSAVPWTSKVYAAFSCTVSTCDTSPYQTALCEIGTDDMTMKSVQVVHRMYSDAHTLKDMKFLYKTYGDGSTALVSLLHLTDERFTTYVEYPYAQVGSYGVVPRVLGQRLVGNQMHSISAFNNDVNDVRFGGIKGVSTPNLTYIREVLPSLFDGDRCMQNDEVDIAYRETSYAPQSDNVPLSELFSGMRRLVWKTKAASTLSVNVGNPCSY